LRPPRASSASEMNGPAANKVPRRKVRTIPTGPAPSGGAPCPEASGQRRPCATRCPAARRAHPAAPGAHTPAHGKDPMHQFAGSAAPQKNMEPAMDTDGPESGRFVHRRNPTTEHAQPCRCDGRCPIGVHRCASVVPNFLLASSHATRPAARVHDRSASQDAMHLFTAPAVTAPSRWPEGLPHRYAAKTPCTYSGSHAATRSLAHHEMRRP
jgi:hypothetical protein